MSQVDYFGLGIFILFSLRYFQRAVVRASIHTINAQEIYQVDQSAGRAAQLVCGHGQYSIARCTVTSIPDSSRVSRANYISG